MIASAPSTIGSWKWVGKRRVAANISTKVTAFQRPRREDEFVLQEIFQVIDILIVEDNSELCGLLCDFLRAENYTVSTRR